MGQPATSAVVRHGHSGRKAENPGRIPRLAVLAGTTPCRCHRIRASAALGDLVRPVGTPMTGIVMQDWKGMRLGEFGNPPGVPPMRFFYRRDLYRVLHEEAGRRGIRIEHGKRLVSAADASVGVAALAGSEVR